MKLEFAPEAQRDLREIASYIARDNPERARSFVAEIRSKCESLIDFPGTGTPRPELRPGLRSKPHGRYVIFYAFGGDVVRVERVLHAARDIATFL